MTYILKIWQPAKGQRSRLELASVLADVAALEDGQARPSRHFAALLAVLTRQYPDITSAEAREMAESEWAWSDGPLDDAAQDTVLVLGLRSGKVDEVQPFVIEQATARGLAVLDAQAGAAWFPGNVRLGATAPARTRQAAVAADRMPNCGEAALLLFDALAPLLSAAGFRPARSKRRFRRTFEAGWQEVVVMTKDYGRGACGFSLMGLVRIHAVSELHARVFLQSMPEKDRQALATVVLLQRGWMPEASPLVAGDHREYYVKQPAQLAQLREQAIADCSGHLLPLLDASRSVDGLDRLLNPDPLHKSIFFAGYAGRLDAHIWTAYLAGNPRLEALCEQILQHVRGDQFAYAARTCVEFVRAHPLD